MNLPPPPDDLMIRIGVSPALPTRDERVAVYDDVGASIYQNIRDAVTHQSGQTVLDFGCGTGRVLRWFAAEPNLNLVGCDIHEASVAWMQASFPPAVRLYANGHAAPLPEADDTFDLIYCGSVFSHLTDWAPWLLELRRILKPGGALVASLHGRGFWEEGFHGTRGVPWEEDHTGMLVEHYGSTFDDSWGPAVYVSEWWVREHWGRALEIERFEPTGFGSGRLNTLLSESLGQNQALEAHIADLHRRLSVFENSRSWKLTRPLRSVVRQVHIAKR